MGSLKKMLLYNFSRRFGVKLLQYLESIQYLGIRIKARTPYTLENYNYYIGKNFIILNATVKFRKVIA